MLICPEANKAQNSMAAVSADGSTVLPVVVAPEGAAEVRLAAVWPAVALAGDELRIKT